MDVLSPKTIAAPANPSPKDGAVLETSLSTFSWSPTPGAGSYSVYIDNNYIRTTAATQFNLPADLHGAHTWNVIAHLGGSSLGSPTWSVALPAPKIQMALRQVQLPESITTESKGVAVVELTNSGNAPLLAPIQLALSASASRLPGNGEYLGNITIRKSVVAGGVLRITIPLAFSHLTPGVYRLTGYARGIGADRNREDFTTLYSQQKITVHAAPLRGATNGIATAAGRFRPGAAQP